MAQEPASPAQEADAERRRLELVLGAFAHDVRTPAGAIVTLADLLASADLGPRERAWAEAIRDAAEHLVATTTLVLDGLKTETGLIGRPATFEPRALASALETSLAARAAAKGLGHAVTVAPGVPAAVTTDAVRMRGIIEALVENALKFTRSGEVALDLGFEPPGRLVWTVTDSGPGIPEAFLGRLFEPFAQGDEEIARRHGGTGLGLASARRVAKALGGSLELARSGTGGTVARLVWPAEPVALDKHGATTGNGLDILVIEDSPVARLVMRTILSELGHRITFAGTGTAALEILASATPDVALVDLTLPDMDGIALVREIRGRQAPAGRVPLVAISGRDGEADRAAALGAGVDAYLTKPVSPRGLAETITRVVAGS